MQVGRLVGGCADAGGWGSRKVKGWGNRLRSGRVQALRRLRTGSVAAGNARMDGADVQE